MSLLDHSCTPFDIHIVDMPRDSFCPILLGRPFVSITKARIDNKKETISLMFGEEEMAFRFAKLKKRPYEVEDIKTKQLPSWQQFTSVLHKMN